MNAQHEPPDVGSRINELEQQVELQHQTILDLIATLEANGVEVIERAARVSQSSRSSEFSRAGRSGPSRI